MKDNPKVYIVMFWYGDNWEGNWIVDDVFIEKQAAEERAASLKYETEIIEKQTK